MFIESRDECVVEVDGPDAVVNFFECEILAAQCQTDEEVFAVEFDRSLRTDFAYLGMLRIIGFWNAAWHLANRRLVMRGRDVAVETLVRAHAVVVVDECVEADLLSVHVGFRRQSCFLFEGPVHAFVTSILLRLSGRNPLMANAKLDPPRAQQRQAKHALRCERMAVVGSNGIGQTVIAKDACENGADPLVPDRTQAVTGEQVAAVGVGHGERIAIDAVEQSKLPFEVCAPDLIGRTDVERSRRRMRDTPSPFPRPNQAMANQYVTGCTLSRQWKLGFGAGQVMQDFTRSPGWTCTAHGYYAGLNSSRRTVRTCTRNMTAGQQTALPLSLVTSVPLVPCFTADAVALA